MKIIRRFSLVFLACLLIFSSFGTVTALASSSNDSYEFLLKWGEEGSEASQFEYPHSVAIDNNNNVYIADLGNNRIQKFDCNGQYITQWGSTGSSIGEIDYPSSIGFDGDNCIYVIEQNNGRVQVFDLDGNYVRDWSIPNNSSGIAIDKKNGYVYIADSDNNQIIKYDMLGVVIDSWGNSSADSSKLCEPRGLALDKYGYLYVADCWNNRVVKYSTDGDFISSWGDSSINYSSFSWPCYLTINSDDEIFVVDWGNRCVKYFDLNGNYINQFGSSGQDDGQFYNPNGISVDQKGNIYVADTNNHRVQKFGTDTPPSDNPPIITISSPKDNAVVPFGTPIDFMVYDDIDGESCEYSATLTTQTSSVGINSGYIPESNIYDLNIQAIDSAGNVAVETRSFVIYNPSGSFVTGGGWINSPNGAYSADSGLVGKATFEIDSKYNKNASVPSGHIGFKFEVAGFEFSSTSFDWLIVTGPKAQCKGYGTINGQGNYAFILTAVDGVVSKNKKANLFRIKIWDHTTDEIIYDNQAGTNDTADLTAPGTSLQGGSIKVHK